VIHLLIAVLILVLAGCGGTAEAERRSFFIEAPPKITSDTPLEVYNTMLDRIDYDREAEELARMTPGQRAVYALNATTDEINNGGFSQYYWNTAGNLSAEAIDGARLVAAKPYEQLLRSGEALFPDGRIPAERTRRQELVDSGEVPEGKLNALNERWFEAEERKPLDDYLAAYIREHPDEFFRGS
jgi:YD repeat-containing protein